MRTLRRQSSSEYHAEEGARNRAHGSRDSMMRYEKQEYPDQRYGKPFEVHSDDTSRSDVTEDVEFGVAVSTGNYAAFVQQKQREQAMAPVAEHRMAQFSEQDGDAVIGLPVETRNYMALLGGAGTAVQRKSVNYSAGREYGQVASSYGRDDANRGQWKQMPPSNQAQHEDDDVEPVLGLPVSTGNYAAMISHPASHRQQSANRSNRSSMEERTPPQSAAVYGNHGYQSLAMDRRFSAPAFGQPEPIHDQLRQDHYNKHDVRNDSRGLNTEDNGGAQAMKNRRATEPIRSNKNVRVSCFDDPNGTHGVVPHAGWLFIRSQTLKKWKKQYAVVSGLEFKYSTGPGHSPKEYGIIESIRERPEETYGLTITLAGGREIVAYCEREVDYDGWFSAVNKELNRMETQKSRTQTNYVLNQSAEGFEGYLSKLERNRTWKEYYFILRQDGFLMCKENPNTLGDPRSSGYVQAVSFADNHQYALAIQLDSGVALIVGAASYEEQMTWYTSISALVSQTKTKTPPSSTAVRSGYVKTLIKNHSGWLNKQTGLFKSWKRLFFTLHGNEIVCAKDTTLPKLHCERVRAIEDWDGKVNGFLIRMESGSVWKVQAETYDSAKQWRSTLEEACRRSGHKTLQRQLSRRKGSQVIVFGGWLTAVKNGIKVRQYYVLDGSTLGYADDIHNHLTAIGVVVDVGAARDLECGMVITFQNRSQLKVAMDSVESNRMWYEVLNAAVRADQTQ